MAESDLRDGDRELLQTIAAGFDSVGAELDAVRLRSALGETMKLATAVNVYLDVNAPWSAVKTDKDGAAKTIYTALRAIDSLKVMFSPFLPFTCEKLHGFLGYENPISGEQFTEEVTDLLGTHKVLRYRGVGRDGIPPYQWKPSELKPGQKLNQPAPLFKKLEPSVAEEERGRLGQ